VVPRIRIASPHLPGRMRGMDSTTAFAAALAVVAAGGAVAFFARRGGAAAVQERLTPDNDAYRRLRDQRSEMYVEFSTAAGKIAATVMLWSHLPQAARPHALDQANAHMQELRARHAGVLADSDTDIRDAADAVVADCERLIGALVLDADPGPEELRLAAERNGLTLPFLRACREYLDTEAERHFGLRPTGRSLFGRLSTR